MESPVVFLNKGLASTLDVLKIIRDARQPGEFRLVATHPRADFPGRWIADDFEVEPDDQDDAGYVAWCLDVVRRHHVTLFVPGRKVRAIATAGTRFEAIGARLLLAGEPRTLALVEDKAACYAAIAPEVVARPDHVVAHDVAGFESAVTALAGRGHRVCFKPTTSVYGLGFRIIAVHDDVDDLADHPAVVTLADARRYLRARPFRRQLVMHYLPGTERSVDCLARRGDLILAIVRRKGTMRDAAARVTPRVVVDRDPDVVSHAGSEPQWVEANPALLTIVRRLTSQLGLDGMFNVQFRDDARGHSHLLEINARMSGGLPMACQSGVAVPYWAIRLALGTATVADVPRPRTGFVATPTTPVLPLSTAGG